MRQLYDSRPVCRGETNGLKIRFGSTGISPIFGEPAVFRGGKGASVQRRWSRTLVPPSHSRGCWLRYSLKAKVNRRWTSPVRLASGLNRIPDDQQTVRPDFFPLTVFATRGLRRGLVANQSLNTRASVPRYPHHRPLTESRQPGSP